VLTYDEAAGGDPVATTYVNVPAPTAMMVSANGTKLYLASSVSASGSNDPNGPAVYRFAIAGPHLTSAGTATVSFPMNFPSDRPALGSRAAITAMAEDPGSGSKDGTLYAVGFVMPVLPADLAMRQIIKDYFKDVPQLFTQPVLVVLPPESDHAKAVAIQGGTDGPALPLSVVWTGQ
jgi:hypothetical protein